MSFAEDNQRKFDLITKSFGLLISGISWLSLNLETIRVCTYPVGLILLGASVFIVVCAISNKWARTAEDYLKRFQLPYVLILVPTVFIALYYAVPRVQSDWRFQCIFIALLVFFSLLIITLVVVIISRIINRDYKRADLIAMVIIIFVFGITCLADIPAFFRAIRTISIQTVDITLGIAMIMSPLFWESVKWDIVTAIFAILAFVISFIGLFYAITSGKKHTKYLSNQTELLRKQVFGQLYPIAQVDNLSFIIPPAWKHKIDGFIQTDKEQNLGTYLAIPTNKERELHIRWRWSQNQTLIGYDIGFKDPTPNTPQILEKIYPFRKQSFQEFTRDEYEDYHGWYHTEYAHLRRVAKDDYFVTAIKVKSGVTGRYVLSLEIKVHEAPNYIGELIVECVDSPNFWAEDYWI